MKKAILIIVFGLGLLLGPQGCNNKQAEYEPAEQGTPSYIVPKEGKEKIDLEDEPVEEPLPYEEEEWWSEEPVEPEEIPEPEPDFEDIPETEPSEPDIEEDSEFKDDFNI